MDKYIGIDVGGTKIQFYSENEGQIYEKKVSSGPNYTRSQLINDITEYLKNLPFQPLGIGIGIPGLIENNKVISALNIPGIVGFDRDDVNNYNCNVVLINDVNAAAIEEQQYYPENSTIVVVINGTGMGVAIIDNGKLILGSKGWSGEIGHSPIEVNGEIHQIIDVACGQGILKQSKLHIEEFISRLNNNDEVCKQVIYNASKYFGIVLCYLIGLYNPNYLIYGGNTLNFKGYIDNTLKIVESHCIDISYQACAMLPAHDMILTVVKGSRRYGKLMAN